MNPHHNLWGHEGDPRLARPEGWACLAKELKKEVPQGHHEITSLVQLAQSTNGEK